MNSAQLAPAVVVPLIVWRVYVRVRRNIGPQRFQPKRLKVRVVIFTLITAAFAAAGTLHPMVLAGLVAGLAGGAALAWWGVRLTTFARTPAGDVYTPNTVIGVALSLVLVGRLAYRMIGFYQMTRSGGAPSPVESMSPLTFAILGLTFGYYVAYYAGILARARRAFASGV